MTTRIYKTTIQAGVPTPNKGVIYSQEKLEGAIREYLDGDNHMGMLESPELSYEDSFELQPELISHNVKNVFLDEDGVMCVEIAFLDTPQGNVARVTPDLLKINALMMGFCGWEEGSNVVEEAAIFHFNFEWKVEEVELAA